MFAIHLTALLGIFVLEFWLVLELLNLLFNFTECYFGKMLNFSNIVYLVQSCTIFGGGYIIIEYFGARFLNISLLHGIDSFIEREERCTA